MSQIVLVPGGVFLHIELRHREGHVPYVQVSYEEELEFYLSCTQQL